MTSLGVMQRSSRYSAVAIALHWLIALGIASLVVIGLVMVQVKLAPFTTFKLYQLHKSIGISVLLLVVLRVLWRLTHRPPPLPPGLSRPEIAAANTAHVLLYVLMIGMPLSGWAVVSASPLNIPTVLFGVIPWPHLPVLSSLADKKPVDDALASLHAYGAWILIALVGLHAAAALRHHLILRDDVLRRMWPTLRIVLAVSLLGATPALAANWTVDPARSTLGFSGAQTGTPFQGRFKSFTASISFDPAKPETGRVAVDVDMASATTGDTQRDEALPQADWFDVGKFPRAHFEASSFRAKGGDAYEALGKLSIRGISVDCVLPFTLRMTGDTAHARGHVQLLRTAFGVGQGAWSTGDMVALEVGVDIDLTAVRAPGGG